MPPSIARVEPLTTTRAVSGPFDYRLEDGQAAEIGTLLMVPFGVLIATGPFGGWPASPPPPTRPKLERTGSDRPARATVVPATSAAKISNRPTVRPRWRPLTGPPPSSALTESRLASS